MEDSALIHLRVSKETKGKWVRASRASGLRLTDWIIEAVQAQHPEIKMTKKYQLADLANGRYGDIYDTEAEAEAALADEVGTHLESAKEEIMLAEERDADAQSRPVVTFSDEELVKLAEARIRDFISVVEAE